MAEIAEKEEKKLEPTSKVEEVGPCKLKVNIEITAEKVQEEIDDKYQELNDSTALPGFRKGHAPRALMERKFGKEILDKLKFELVNTSFTEVKEEKKLEPIGEPDIDLDKLSVEAGKAFTYEITMEVRPTLEIKEYSGLSVTKPKIDVTSEDIDRVIENFRDARAELVPASDSKAKEGDQIICDFELVSGDKSLQKAENQALFLTEHISFFGTELKDFHKQVEGKKAGDILEVKVTLPDTYKDKEHAGKEAVLKASIKGIKRKDLPELNEDFAKAFDCDTMEELREYLKKRILREKEEESKQYMADQLVDTLVEKNDFPMPEGLVKSGTEEAIARSRIEMMTRGLKEDEIEKKVAELDGESRENMVKLLKTNFILDHIAETERIFVTEDQVEDRLQKLAAHHGVWPHELKAKMEEDGSMPQLRRQMRHDAVRDFLLSKATVEEAGDKPKK
jgi:trigger factor